jgi:2-(1,2-epoxy-1,2-dihydrophenyl)acetyl-CoA isomerase
VAEDEILFEVADGIATIRLNRPHHLNALTVDVLARLRDFLSEAEEDAAIRCFLITGTGRAFSTGQDLSVVHEGKQPNADRVMREDYNTTILALRAASKPVVAAVNGVAAGAGMSLALASDFVVAARSAYFLQAFARIALVPDAGSTYFLVRALGGPRARALAMLAEPLPAEQAEAWGLIWKCVDDDQVMGQATALAARLAKGPPLAQAKIKKIMNAAETATLAAQLELEGEYQVELARTDDFAEGVDAFINKRDARFKGR